MSLYWACVIICVVSTIFYRAVKWNDEDAIILNKIDESKSSLSLNEVKFIAASLSIAISFIPYYNIFCAVVRVIYLIYIVTKKITKWFF